MKRYCGCNRPTECRKRTCEDEERAAEKIRLPIFWLPYFFSAVKCLWNGGRHDRLEQPNGTKGTTVERQFDCPAVKCKVVQNLFVLGYSELCLITILFLIILAVILDIPL